MLVGKNKVEKFEDLQVWQASFSLAVALYEQLKDCRDFGLKDQMQRSAVSIASNIAEGFDRQTRKEFIQFLYIARGSCSELRTQIYIAKKVNILPKAVADTFAENSRKISAMLYKLIQYRKNYTST